MRRLKPEAVTLALGQQNPSAVLARPPRTHPHLLDPSRPQRRRQLLGVCVMCHVCLPVSSARTACATQETHILKRKNRVMIGREDFPNPMGHTPQAGHCAEHARPRGVATPSAAVQHLGHHARSPGWGSQGPSDGPSPRSSRKKDHCAKPSIKDLFKLNN